MLYMSLINKFDIYRIKSIDVVKNKLMTWPKRSYVVISPPAREGDRVDTYYNHYILNSVKKREERV